MGEVSSASEESSGIVRFSDDANSHPQEVDRRRAAKPLLLSGGVPYSVSVGNAS
jgi:hypothetical protein